MQSASTQQLARRFLELWQKQVSAMMTDGELIRDMLESLSAAPASPESKRHANAKATYAAPAHDALLERLDQLDYRLRMVEKRLAGLERGKKKRTAANLTRGVSGSAQKRGAKAAGKRTRGN